jgi:hypothetical protein
MVVYNIISKLYTHYKGFAMHLSRFVFVQYAMSMLLLVSGMQVYAAAGAEMQRMIPCVCDKKLELYRKDMELFFEVMVSEFKWASKMPGITPSGLLSIIDLEKFVVAFRPLKTVSARYCYTYLEAQQSNFDTIYATALQSHSHEAAWEAVANNFREGLMHHANRIIDIKAANCVAGLINGLPTNEVLPIAQLQCEPVARLDR